MFFDDEELLEAVDMLMEDYDLTEDEAIDIVLESYEDEDFDDYELDELSEAIDLLMEDYDLTEDEAIDLLMEEEAQSNEDEEMAKTIRRVRNTGLAINGLAMAGGLGYEAYKRHKINKSPIKKARYKIKKRIEKARRKRERRTNRKIMKKSIKRLKKDLHLK